MNFSAREHASPSDLSSATLHEIIGNVPNLLYQFLVCVLGAEMILKKKKKAGYSDVNTRRKRLLTVAVSRDNHIQDNTDGLKLPAV